jgi:hypothetical protein
VHLDRGYDSGKTRTILAERGLDGHNRPQGHAHPGPGQHAVAGERTHAWATRSASSAGVPSGRRRVVEFYLALAQAIIIVRRLVRGAWTCYRWQARPARRP